MRKKVFSLVAVFVVLILLGVGTFFALKIKPPSQDTSSSSEAPIIKAFNTEKDKIKEINVKSQTDDYVLSRKDKDTFVLATKPNNLLDKTTVDTLLSNLSDLTAEAQITSSALSDFGLDKPNTTVTLTMEDGKKQELLIGSTALKGGYYFKSTASADIFSVSEYTIDSIRPKKLTLYDKTITSGATAENITLIDVKRENDPFRVEKTKQELTSTEQQTGGSFLQVVSPIKSEVNADSFSKDVVGKLIAISATETFSDDFSGANLAKYSLDKPKYTLTYTFDKTTVTLYVGTLSEKDEYYAVLNGKELIFKIAKDTLSFLELPVGKICSSIQYLTNIKDVNAVKIEGADKRYEFVLSGSDGDNMTVKYDGKDTDADAFRTLYQNIIGIFQTEYTTKKPTQNVALTITFTLKNGKQDVLKFSPNDYRSYYFTLNGTTNFIVSKDSVDKVLANAEKYIKGEKITA